RPPQPISQRQLDLATLYKCVLGSSQDLLKLFQRGNGNDNLFEANQADRINALNITHIDLVKIARRKKQVLAQLFSHNQRFHQIILGQLLHQTLGLGSINIKRLNHQQTILTIQLRENALQSCAVHFLVELLIMITRLGSKGSTTATPDRAANSTCTSATSTLLAPGLLATTGHFCTSQLRFGTLTSACHIGNYSLMHQILIKLSSKSDFRYAQRT